jgi:hypothetical protein
MKVVKEKEMFPESCIEFLTFRDILCWSVQTVVTPNSDSLAQLVQNMLS